MKVSKSILILLSFLLLSFSLEAQEKYIIDKTNEYGGVTLGYSKKSDGLYSVKEFYAFDQKKMKQISVFTDAYAYLYGVAIITTEYMFDKKIKEEKVFTEKFSKTTLIKTTTDYFEQSTGIQFKTKNNFSENYLGYNLIYYKPKEDLSGNAKKKLIREKIEWYYPENDEGISKYIIYFDVKGIEKERVENYYTQKTAIDSGIFKSIYYLKSGKKKRQEWYYTAIYSAENDDIYIKVNNYKYDPLKGSKVTTHYFDKNWKLKSIDR